MCVVCVCVCVVRRAISVSRTRKWLIVQEYLKSVPPSLAYFSREEPDTVVYTGYGLHKYIQLYSVTQGKVRVQLVIH